MRRRAWLLSGLLAGAANGETREQCLALCLDAARQLELDCQRHAKLPEATRKRECAEGRKTIENLCPAECSGNRPKDLTP